MSSNLCQQSQAHRLYSLYLHYDASHTAKHDDPECKAVLQHCFSLFEKDYVVGTVANHGGQLCSSYPSEIAILEKQRVHSTTQQVPQTHKKDQAGDLIKSTQTDQSRHSDHAQLSKNSESLTKNTSVQSASSHISPSHSIVPQSTSDTFSNISPMLLSQRSGANGISINSSGNHNDDYTQRTVSNQEGFGRTLIEETADQSFDLSESEMMSFQDIRSELDMIRSPQTIQQHSDTSNDHDKSKRNILPFPFRISRPERKATTSESRASSISTTDRRTKEPISLTENKDKVNDTQELSKQFEKSHFARVRARFVVPCILVRGKNVCRSATLSNEVEVFMHSVNQKLNDLNQKRKMFLYGTGEKSPDKEDHESSLEKQRMEDIELLHQLGVTYINDLMVENRKVKYGLKVTSSEKVDSFGRYSKFKLVATPYPGVEFFQKFKANKYCGRKLCFDWSQNFADAQLQFPAGHTDNLGISWKGYKSWDLIELTQNYLRLYLTHIADDTVDIDLASRSRSTTGSPSHPLKGLLIHCISGWDRTPLFISLLRISLWADGEVHQSLTAAEMLYLTMGYDWFLFNHLLADRSQRGEDIFYFCFYFLKFIYGEEFSLKSIAHLAKHGKAMHRSSIDTQAVSSQSPLLKNTGRIRNRFDAADAENPHGHICDECRLMRKSPDEPLGRDINPVKSTSQEVASSTDGKSSSWQLVTFSTPPGREKHGSPRAPFIPTLQDFKTSGSPLGIKRNSFTTNYAESSGHGTRPLDREVLDMESQSATNHPAMNSRRFSLSTQQQQLGVRRSSSSGIPNMFSEESRYSISGLSGVEFSQGSISPNLFADRDLEGLGPRSASNSNSDVTGEGQSARRKRASTFDGGLLLFAGQETNVAQDDLDAKAHMEDLTSDDDEDEESGIVNNLTKPSYTAVLAPTNATEPQICQICHRPFLAEPNQTKSESRVTESQLGPLKSPIPVNSDSLNIPQQPMAISPKAALERLRASDTLFPNDAGYDGHRHHSGRHRIHEADRDEAMFQLEIDDQLPYRSIADQDCLNTPCFAGPGCQERVTSVTGNSSAADEIGAIEEDGNESFWEETSTMDYGYSPGSILNGFESGLTKVDSRMSRETPGLKHGAEDEDDVEEEDDDDDDDCVASLTSRQGSHKMSHEHDHIFMPSLKGVFSNSERVAEGRNGRQDHAYVAGESGSSAADTRHPLSTTSNKDHVNVDFDQNQSTTSSETSRPLTRRQKLKQLRRLFMDIRNEIGDGSRSPSRPVPESKTFRATSLSSATEEDDDSSASFRAESFSDDSSYQYRSSNAATIVSAHRQGSATNPPSVSLAKSHDFDPNLPSFSHGLSSTRQNVGSFKMPSGTRPQQQQQTSRWSQQTQKSLIAPPSSGRKSPFEWAAAAATSAAASISSSASGIITGGFGHVGSSTSCADHSSSLDRAGRRAHHTTPQLQEYTSPTGSNHYNRQFTLSSAYNQYQQPQQCEGNFSQRKDSIPETTPIDDFQEVMAPSTTLNMIEREGQAGSGIGTSSRSDRAPGYRRRSSLGLTPTTSSATSASRIRGETENSNRWEWPIFV